MHTICSNKNTLGCYLISSNLLCFLDVLKIWGIWEKILEIFFVFLLIWEVREKIVEYFFEFFVDFGECKENEKQREIKHKRIIQRNI